MPRSLFERLFLPELAVLIIVLIALADQFFSSNILQGLSIGVFTAATFIVCSVSKLFFENAEKNKRLLLVARVLAGCTIIIGVINIIALVFNFLPAGSEKSMAFITAFCFCLLGIALYRITLYNSQKVFLSHVLSLIILFIALLSVISYFFHQTTFYKISFFRPMRIITATCFSLLAFSILRVNKRKGFIGDLTSEHQGGKIARVLIPMAIVIPVVLGFFQLRTERTAVYTHPYDIALLTLARIIILVLFIWRTAVIINRSNKKVVAEIEERKKNENVLKYRTALLEAQNEAIPDAVLVVDKTWKILTYNHHFAEMWRIPQEIMDGNVPGATLELAMKQPEDPREFMERLNYIYTHPEENAHDEILFKDGRVIERYGNIVVGDDGTQYGWAWYFRDITAGKNYENKIKNFTTELEAKVKERTEELNKSEMRFRLLVENSLDIISLVSADGRITYISPSIKRLTGFTEKELIGKFGLELVHPNDVEGGKKFQSSLIDMPFVPAKSTFRFLHKKGGYVWLEGTATNMLADENVNAFVLNYHDITERKNAEENLRNSEKRFRSLLENAHDLISLSDGKEILFYISPSVERITGRTIAESINQSVFAFVHPDDIKYGEKIRKEFLKRPGESISVSFRYQHKNGNYIWMEGTVINLLHDENVKAVVGNYHDVTERKIAEEKIRVSNERFEMVSKATNDAVWDWNLQTDEIYWNEEIRSMFNYCAEDIPTGTEWKKHIHPEDFTRVTRKIVYHIKNHIEKWQDEYRFRCADGTYKYVFNRGFILFNSDNNPYRIIGAMQDVTQINKLQKSLNDERIKKQKELTNATIQGQEKERTEIGRELHDNINQLLTATKLYLDVAVKQQSMKDEMIMRSTENLSVCMEEIRKLSSTLVPPSMGLNSFDEIIKDLLEPIKLATTINVDYEIKDVDKNMLTNDQQLNVYRIIQEHFNNILKHSKANNVFLSIQHLDGHIELKIKDDGQGFNVSVKQNGIGFKNIQSRSQLLNGKMNVVSSPGKGCLLKVNFPVYNSEIDTP
jgi:PAS domain S-box